MIKFNTPDSLIKTAHRLGLNGFFVYTGTEGNYTFVGNLEDTTAGWKVSGTSVHDIDYPVFMSKEPH